jgi:hypothetical protein
MTTLCERGAASTRAGHAIRIAQHLTIACLLAVPLVPAFGQLKLSQGLTTETQVSDYRLSPADDTIVYRAGSRSWGRPHVRSRLFAVADTGGGVTALTPALPAESGVAAYAFTPDGQRVVYRADAPTPGHYAL